MLKPEASVPRPFLLGAVALSACGLVLLYLVARAYPVDWTAYLLLMMIAAVLSEHFAPVIRGHSASISLPLAVAALALQGPAAAAVVAGVSALRRDSVDSPRLFVVTAFNFGQYLTIFCLSGLIYVGLGGPLLDGDTMRQLTLSDFPDAVVPMTAAIALCSLGNVAVTAYGIAALYQNSLRATVLEVAPYGASLVALGFVGYLMAQVVASSVFALPLFLFPLILARQVYQRYAELDDAYVDTIRSLVGALEAKDPYTRGHSERVAGYAVRLGRAVKEDERSLEVLEKSALLHDIGKIALSSEVLTKPSRLSDIETAMMRSHPEVGASMISRIPPLRPLSELILNHHERFDGSGYPAGRAGDQTPVFSKILSIADAYDAMTTNRAYRRALSEEYAAAEILNGAGTQFDPHLAAMFVSVVSATENEDPVAAGTSQVPVSAQATS